MPDTGRTVPRLTLATKVTLLRFLGIPVFVLMMVYYTLGLREGAADERYRVMALVTFLAVALTDALDGYLARSRGEITQLGRILDPLADKTLLLAAIIMLTRPSLPALHPQIPVWFALAVISRDALLVLGAFVVHHLNSHVEVRPRWSGKLATVLQMGTVLWVLADAPARPFPWLAGAAAVLTVVAGGQYILDGIRQIEHSHRAPPLARA
ncbi:MAG: CDP-alcohol phosphatidyltransferase family protein [Lentisphaerae bacterium]|nr:CDP-alcohol phosphatidyltransferase family protein [Lentisphaerota bacterium]